MEDVLAVYEMPYVEEYPVVCMDETCKQLIGEVKEPIACAPGTPERIDHEYVRNGVAEVFMEVEPLTGQRHGGLTTTKLMKRMPASPADILASARRSSIAGSALRSGGN